MREILVQRGFTEDEISTLETREDYAEIRERVEQMQADRLLDELQARTEAGVEAAEESLDARWEAFKAHILEITGADEAPESIPETLEDMRARLETEAIERVDAGIRQRFEGIPLIGGMLAEFMIEQRQSFLEPSEGFSLKKLFVTVIAGFFGLKGVFNSLQGEIDAARNAELPEVQVPDIPDGSGIEVPTEVRNAAIYTAGVELIMGLSEDDNDTTEQLFNQPNVKESSFSTLVDESFTLDGIDTEDISALRTTLLSQEGLIDSILGRENTDWRSLSLLEIFEQIGAYGESIASLNGINPEDILSGSFSIGSLSLGEGGAILGTLGTLFERFRNSETSIFHGVSEGLFIEIIREDRKNITDDDVESLFSTNSFDSENDTRFEQGFIEFGRGFLDRIISDFYLGPDESRAQFENFIRDRGLTYREVLEFMILTGGSLDSSNYNDAVKTIIYTKIWGILGEGENWENSVRSDTYNTAFREYINNGVTEGMENVPPQVFVIGRRLLGAIQNNVERVAESTGNMILEMWRFLGLEGQLIVAGTSAAILLALFRSRLFLARASGIGMGLQVGIIGTIVFMARGAFANTEFRSTYPEIGSEEALINSALRQLQEDGIDLTDGVGRLRAGELGFDIDHTQIAALEAPSGGTGSERPVPDGVETERREYRSFMFHPDILESDGMELIRPDGDIYSQSHGILTIQKDRRNLEVTFMIDGEVHNTYFRSEGGFWDGISDNVLENSVFVTNSSGEVFLAVYRAGGVGSDTYVYISLADLERQIQESNGEEILVAEDLYMRFDLIMNNS